MLATNKLNVNKKNYTNKCYKIKFLQNLLPLAFSYINNII